MATSQLTVALWFAAVVDKLLRAWCSLSAVASGRPGG